MIDYGTVRITRIEPGVTHDGEKLERVYVELISVTKGSTTQAVSPGLSGLVGPGYLLCGEQTPQDVEVGDVLECEYSSGSTSGGYLLRWPVCSQCGHYRRHLQEGPPVCEACADKMQQDADDAEHYKRYGCSPYEY